MQISPRISRRSGPTSTTSGPPLAALALREGDRGIFFERDETRRRASPTPCLVLVRTLRWRLATATPAACVEINQ